MVAGKREPGENRGRARYEETQREGRARETERERERERDRERESFTTRNMSLCALTHADLQRLREAKR